MAKAQRYFARKKKDSNRRNKQKLKVTKVYEKVKNSRADFLHKLSTQITNEHDVICVENLHVSEMMKNRKLAKSIGDVSWASFLGFLQYKSDWNDRTFVRIDRWFPSSKTCFECGNVKSNLSLSDRNWTCENGHTLDRDVNAAKNILKEGTKSLSSGADDYIH